MTERPWWQKIIYQVWPTIYRIINQTIWFVLMILRTTVKMAIKQIKRKY